MIKVDYSRALEFVTEQDMEAIKADVLAAKKTLVDRTGEGNDFIGWLDLPENYDKEEYARIKKAAAKIQSDSDVLLVVGIGGSYLGARATIEALTNNFYNIQDKKDRKTPQIFFCGNNVSASYAKDLMGLIGDRDFSINVISKSGTTTEPAIAFRFFKKMLEDKYGEAEASKRIYATTDKEKGALKTLADKNGYEEFVVPNNVGGRYSVLTAVGLLPIAVAGIDLDALMKGAQDARKACLDADYKENNALLYAAFRNVLYRAGKEIEIMVDYEPKLHFIAEWWKQLYGESEGKDKKGIYPASVDFTTDLHSLGQFIQDGSRIMFETVLTVDECDTSMVIESDADNLDQLNYLAGREMDFVNKAAQEGTIQAHTAGKTPNLVLHMQKLDAYNLGELFYTFEFACGVSGYMLGVNPFNQPGVEMYKKNMFKLLGKPGY